MRHRFWITPALILLTACGAQTPASADFNDADVTFATQMIPHHQQAVQMAGMAGHNATNRELKNLATAIEAAQDPEIKTLATWLTTWDKPVPAPSHGGHGGHEMPGMMTEDDMSELGNTKGAQFDRQWTQLMIEHHQGAVAMAKTEQSTGKYPEAVALAGKIQSDQSAEITTLQRLLAKLPTS
ncbi:DUF305 domain-containing protein [Kribbella antibiotica]|uniref:DUF305 domain-containing protein n=1 Tax=Kribbella antibiotica TaxID=190195 RepID=A0A4R4YTC0_9ACTN|nr:DUF305 domain-containing protein [Kribbella antibiotica]TDD48565.1 DUF305 domain-containing protein [Kribbella antibiotica]